MHDFPFSSYVRVSGLRPVFTKIICLIGTQDICIKGFSLHSTLSKTWNELYGRDKNNAHQRRMKGNDLRKSHKTFSQWTTYFCHRCCFSFTRWANHSLGLVYVFVVVAIWWAISLFRCYAAPKSCSHSSYFFRISHRTENILI